MWHKGLTWFCVFYVGKDKRRWEEEVFKFARLQQLRAVSCYLPRGDSALDPHIYEMVLYEYLKMEPQVSRLFQSWAMLGKSFWSDMKKIF
jgi:hypothetical protein